MGFVWFCSWSCTQSGPPRTPNFSDERKEMKKDEEGIKRYKQIEIDSGLPWALILYRDIQAFRVRYYGLLMITL